MQNDKWVPDNAHTAPEKRCRCLCQAGGAIPSRYFPLRWSGDSALLPALLLSIARIWQMLPLFLEKGPIGLPMRRNKTSLVRDNCTRFVCRDWIPAATVRGSRARDLTWQLQALIHRIFSRLFYNLLWWFLALQPH